MRPSTRCDSTLKHEGFSEPLLLKESLRSQGLGLGVSGLELRV